MYLKYKGSNSVNENGGSFSCGCVPWISGLHHYYSANKSFTPPIASCHMTLVFAIALFIFYFYLFIVSVRLKIIKDFNLVSVNQTEWSTIPTCAGLK